MFQGFNLLQRDSALSNIMLPMVYAGFSTQDQERRARKALQLVGLEAWANHLPSQLSGGQQQRIAIARSLVNSPALLLADEPTGNLDTRTSLEIMAVLQALNHRGITIVVVGTLQPKGQAGGSTVDDVIYVPFTTALNRLNNTSFVSSIQAQVDNVNNVSQAQQDVTTILEKQHHIQAGATLDFRVFNSNQLIQTAQQSIAVLAALLIGIAAISLTVGGIGIMNIMLVSVSERTREIGIRMAVGARQSGIRNQFLIEALALSVVGGIIGIIFGLIAGLALVAAFQQPFAPSLTSILLAFGVSASVGAIFGFYPALRASRLDPIVALRTD